MRPRRPAQAATCRRASVGTGYDVRWNADHHAGHGLPATPRARRGEDREQAPKGAERRRFTTRGSSGSYIAPVQRTRRWRCPSRRRLCTLRRLSPTPASGSSSLMSAFRLTGAWGLIPVIATTTFATISPDNGSCPACPLPLIALVRHSETKCSSLLSRRALRSLSGERRPLA